MNREEKTKNGSTLLLVMQKVMCQIIADISKDSTAINCNSGVPVVEKDKVGEMPERCCKDEEESRWHNETVAVHG